jgi:hypothetical protein
MRYIQVGGRRTYQKKEKIGFDGKLKMVNDYSKPMAVVGGFKYKSGFHFYDLESAKVMLDGFGGNDRVIIECAVTDIRVKGTDRYGTACVAQQFTPLREIKYTRRSSSQRLTKKKGK